MEEQQQKDVAVFRFGVISDFVTRGELDRGEQERVLAEKCERTWQIPHSNRSRLARSTILGWIKAYRDGGGRLESLYPNNRNDQGMSRVIDEETGALIVRLRTEMPRCSLPKTGRGPQGGLAPARRPAQIRSRAPRRSVAKRRHARSHGPGG